MCEIGFHQHIFMLACDNPHELLQNFNKRIESTAKGNPIFYVEETCGPHDKHLSVKSHFGLVKI